MGLKKLCLTAGLAVLGSLLFAPGALAWTFSASGSSICDTSKGEHVITWSIDNRTEPETLTIRESNRGAVPVGSTIAARSIRQFTERVAGSTGGTITLNVKGNWPSDQTKRSRWAYVSLSATCVADVCPNIEGVQTQVPSGMVKESSGNCGTPPTDQCPNLAGVQVQVPAGMARDVAGNCFTPPTDVCPNIEGIQTQVPAGMIKDAEGRCTTPPTDQCPNLEGVQEQVPGGMATDTEGNCYTPPTDVCPNIDGLQTALPEGFVKEESGNCTLPPRVVTLTETIEKTVFVPVERLVTVSAAPVTVEKIVDRVVTKVVVKRAKVANKKKKKKIKRKLKRRVLPFTPHTR
jgi:hypothetical protein